ncbi:MAG: hypothetical protein Q8P68_05470 [Candidatus Peregrinibacteria bacterium]|nr:hypothetical protein [Candidatus Peregrinibacteria bacterium]MDZ4244359.1 hypothetical protein [Candidatus Gracilibacteria bacterium]
MAELAEKQLEEDRIPYAMHQPTLPDGYEQTRLAITDALSDLTISEVSLPSIKIQKSENNPNSWEDCYIDGPEDGAKIIDFKKAVEYINTKRKIADFSPELRLALSNNPCKTGPFGLEMQSFPIGQGKQKKMIQDNLMFLFKLGIIESGFPKGNEETLTELSRKLIKQYKKNLSILMRNHKEIETQDGKFSVQDIMTRFARVKILDINDMNNEKVSLAKHTLNEARTVAKEQMQNNDDSRSGDIDSRSPRIPLSFLKSDKEEVVIKLLVLLDLLGEIQLGEISGASLLSILQILKWSSYKATEFLNTGERMIKDLQRKMREPGDFEDYDKAHFLKKLEIMNFYELLAFTMNPKNSIDWRNQATLRAYAMLKFIRIRTNHEYRHVEESADVMAEARESFDFEKDEEGNPDWASFTYYENAKGDRSTIQNDEYTLEVNERARIWESPLSDIRYATFFFGEKPIKEKLSIALKAHIKNSGGDPKKLLDLVRDGIVMYPIDENRNMLQAKEVIMKDKLYFIYSYLKEIKIEIPKTEEIRGVSLCQKNGGMDLKNVGTWQTHSAQEIYDSLLGRKPCLEKPGNATIEDTELRGLNGNSNQLFRCMKLLLRMPEPLRTGCEFQIYDPKDYCEIMSPSSPAHHKIYEYLRSLELHGNFYPGQYFPGTQLNDQALRLNIASMHLMYMYDRSQNEGYQRHAQLLKEKIELLNKVRRDIENGERGAHCDVNLAVNDDLYAIANINRQIEELNTAA